MNRKEFGKLVAALRKGRRNEHFQKLTQWQLAQQAGISEQVLGNIERGAKVTFESDLLLAIAEALQLSTRERHEFFLAAIGVEEEKMPACQPEPCKVFDELFNSLARISLPAFIADSFDDIVAANNIILNLFEFSEDLISIAPDTPGGYNVIRFVFSQKSLFNRILGQHHENYLKQSIRFFRAISLPHRANPYYQYLLTAFHRDRDMALFQQYFNRDSHESETDDYYFEGEQFTIQHAFLGKLDFYSPSIFPVSTSKGSLYLIAYIPANTDTTQACALLASQTAPGASRLAPWPEKEIP
jgi:DNA-binding XRE family transcriptional regulator